MLLQEHGFSILVDSPWLPDLESLCAWTRDPAAGHRNLLDLPKVGALAGGSILTDLIAPVLGPQAFAVRGILFDKTARMPTGW